MSFYVNYWDFYYFKCFLFKLLLQDFPDERPRIDNTLITVDQNTPVTIRCYLSTRGNPPVAWLWYCDDKLQSKGVRSTGAMSTLMVIAKLKDHNAACHCRAKSDSQWGSYDKNSSKAIINIKSETYHLKFRSICVCKFKITEYSIWRNHVRFIYELTST